MNEKFIPLGKRSKREQREHFAKRRGTWGKLSPITRKSPNPKIYKRSKFKYKSGEWSNNEPHSGFYLLYVWIATLLTSVSLLQKLLLAMTEFNLFLTQAPRKIS